MKNKSSEVHHVIRSQIFLIIQRAGCLVHLFVMNDTVLLRVSIQGDEQAVLCWKCVSVYICCPEFFKNSGSLINNGKGTKSTLKETFTFNRRPYLVPMGGIYINMLII